MEPSVRNDKHDIRSKVNPLHATKDDVRKVAKKMSAAHLECRDFGHTWRQSSVEKVKGGYKRTLWCPTCKANKFETLDRYGAVKTRNIAYEKGYTTKGIGRITAEGRSVFRLASVQRSLNGATSKDVAKTS